MNETLLSCCNDQILTAAQVTCSGNRCESMSNNVLPQVIRPEKQRSCGSPGLVWDNLDHLAHRVANSARRMLGYEVETQRSEA